MDDNPNFLYPISDIASTTLGIWYRLYEMEREDADVKLWALSTKSREYGKIDEKGD
jgi:hypothetical protein